METERSETNSGDQKSAIEYRYPSIDFPYQTGLNLGCGPEGGLDCFPFLRCSSFLVMQRREREVEVPGSAHTLGAIPGYLG